MSNQQSSTAPFWVKILSGSVGSTITALVVTPLEVVKVRQQSQPVANLRVGMPSNVSLCPRGCGTFVLNNGLGECILPRSAVPYFDPNTGRLKEELKVTKSSVTRSNGTFGMLRRIFAKEGFSGIYAGLAPTLVMGVPNTVLYFFTYEELKDMAHQHRDRYEFLSSPLVPAAAGACARFVASLATAPLELIRTRQSATIGGGDAAAGMYTEFRNIVRADGFPALYKGLSPTLLRDVPFSAVYWYSIETMREKWHTGEEEEISAWQQAGQALVNGSTAGMIAAACTTPLDVVKTRRQLEPPQVQMSQSVESSTSVACCDHQGAVAYNHATKNNKPRSSQAPGTLRMMSNILENEGIAGLWRGNQARMIKVAPACALMLSSYEIGKRVLTEDQVM